MRFNHPVNRDTDRAPLCKLFRSFFTFFNCVEESELAATKGCQIPFIYGATGIRLNSCLTYIRRLDYYPPAPKGKKESGQSCFHHASIFPAVTLGITTLGSPSAVLEDCCTGPSYRLDGLCQAHTSAPSLPAPITASNNPKATMFLLPICYHIEPTPPAPG